MSSSQPTSDNQAPPTWRAAWWRDVPRAGSETLRLAVVPGNENAVALYRRNGFRRTGELGDLMPDGVSREHIMAKDLAGACPAPGGATGARRGAS